MITTILLVLLGYFLLASVVGKILADKTTDKPGDE
jgi:hypothetical protein